MMLSGEVEARWPRAGSLRETIAMWCCVPGCSAIGWLGRNVDDNSPLSTATLLVMDGEREDQLLTDNYGLGSDS